MKCLWAIKSKQSSNDEKYSNLPEYTLAQVSEHWQTNDCWVVVEDLVYDITEFLDEHPGGQYIVMEHAGRDATLVFRGSRHSQDAYDMLDKYLIGILIENERVYWSRSRSNTNDSNSSSIYGSSPQPSKGL
ncbi:cytochrome b5-like protein [Dermatophagoides farinae]|uniref:Cytochrome b5-like protein n=1 Tax=Dermatophagoides farinae TaxID=6954 RepID=A0A9D4SB61_DERFA|nr:cytochrome b5-like protein [Dermatophagoides farinae]